MKITILSPEPGQEDEIIIRCAQIDNRVLSLIQNLKGEKSKLTAYADDGITILDTKDVYYFEAVDNRVFAYCEKQVYEIRKKLYELENELTGTDFLRISKSAIANLDHIYSITRNLTASSEVEFNGSNKKALVSRAYYKALTERLSIRKLGK